jgi:hypothetical protein
MQPSNSALPPTAARPGPPGAPPVGSSPTRFAGGAKVDLGKAFNETLQDFTRDLGPYALAGLGLLVLTMAAVMLTLIPFYALIFGGMLLNVAVMSGGAAGGGGTPDSPVPWMVAAIFGLAFFLLIAVLTAITAGFVASLLRAIAAHQRGSARLGFDAVYSTARQGIGAAVGVTLAGGLLAAVGALFCYLPGLIVSFLLFLATPLVVLHPVPVGRALRLSAREVRSDLGFYVKFYAIYLGVSIIAQYVPVIGPMFAVAYFVRVYRELFGDDPVPVFPGGAVG